MKRYDYIREEEEALKTCIIASQGESYSGVGGLLGGSIALAVVVIVYAVCACIAPMTLDLLRKAVNVRDNTPDRGLREMLRAHPVLRVLAYADMACFGLDVLMITAIMQLSHNGRLPADVYAETPIARLIGQFGIYPVYGLMAVGTLLLIIAAVVRRLPDDER